MSKNPTVPDSVIQAEFGYSEWEDHARSQFRWVGDLKRLLSQYNSWSALAAVRNDPYEAVFYAAHINVLNELILSRSAAFMAQSLRDWCVAPTFVSGLFCE